MNLNEKSKQRKLDIAREVVKALETGDFTRLQERELNLPLFAGLGFTTVEAFANGNAGLEVKLKKCLAIWKNLYGKPFEITEKVIRTGQAWNIRDGKVYLSSDLKKLLDYIDAEHREKLEYQDIYISAKLYARLHGLATITVFRRIQLTRNAYPFPIRIQELEGSSRLVYEYNLNDLETLAEFFTKKRRVSK